MFYIRELFSGTILRPYQHEGNLPFARFKAFSIFKNVLGMLEHTLIKH